jgi:hypothetical protein
MRVWVAIMIFTPSPHQQGEGWGEGRLSEWWSTLL